MGYVGVSMCDICGKRTENFAGKLTLVKYKKEPGKGTGYSKYNPTTDRSWSMCKTCLNKLSATESQGDLIREELEVRLDKIRAEIKTGNKNIKLLV